MKQIEVTILGQGYLLGCPEGGETLLHAAVASVDQEMGAIRDGNKVKARERIAVLAALNLAYRLAERGSRFIQLYHRDWDHHSLLREELPLRAREVDRACMALLTDLKRRGLFEDTLVVWSGEFGRTPMKQGDKGPVGRDHHNKAMSMWLAGAGVRGGLTYGATDELGYAAMDKVCTVHDLHATMLHQLGVDHDAFRFKFQGLDAKLTGVEPCKVIKDILA
jgi:cell division protein ZapA (FtsZ GTPase activity inhibitor)